MGIYQWRSLNSNLKLITWIAFASVLSDSLSLVLISQRVSTWPLLNVFYIVQFSLLFFVLCEERRVFLLRLFYFGCLTFALVNFTFIQTPKTFNTYTSYAGGILMIISALSYLYWLINEMPSERVYKLPLFWIAFGVLVYYGGTLFLFLFNNYLIERLPQSHQTIWILHNLLNVTKNVFLVAALWTQYTNRTSPP
jgi:hypothetical protein